MTAINILLEEHKLLLQAIKTTRTIQKIEDNEAYYKQLHNIILFLRNFTEIYHHPKEENIFYPMLRNRSEGMSTEFIRETCDYHEDFKPMVFDIESSYLDYDYCQLRKATDRYITALEEHIRRENEIILSVAHSLLDEEELASLSKAMQKHDDEYGYKEELIKDLYKINMQLHAEY